MPVVELWGATGTLRLMLPERPLVGYPLLIFYLLTTLYLLYQTRSYFRQLTRRQWAGLLLLSVLSLALSQFFPIYLDSRLPPVGVAQNPEVGLVPFGATPLILAGAALNPGAALIVGFFSGLGRAF